MLNIPKNLLQKSAVFATILLVLSTPVYAQDAPLEATTSGAVDNKAKSAIAGLFGQSSKSKFLPVHQAFGVSALVSGDVLTVSIRVTPEHYVYKDKISIKLPDGVKAGAWKFNKSPTTVEDPDFGKVLVFEENVVATAKLTSTTEYKNAPLAVKWQGCAKAGLCYPPEQTKFTANINANQIDKKNENITKPEDGTTKTENDNKTQNLTTDKQKSDSQKPTDLPEKTDGKPAEELASLNQQQDKPPADATASSPIVTMIASEAMQSNERVGEDADNNTMAGDGSTNTQSSNQSTPNHTATSTNADPFGMQKNPMLAILLLFLAGVLLSFTPCVYPMIPIVANIVAREKTHTPIKGFALSASYGLGVATSYGLLGAMIAWFGRAVGVMGWLQNPYVIGVFAIIFALLALYMFDVIKVGLPAFIKNKLQKKSELADSKLGSVGGSFLAGALSALVVSPCVSAPMAGALTAVSASGSVPLGFLALFSLGLGLSIPLMFIGLAQGKFMPKSGEWMHRVKEFCGLLLLAVSLSLLERLLFSPIMLAIWAAWFALVAVWLFRMKNMVFQAFAVVAAIWTVCLMVGVALGAADAWRPLSPLTQTTGQNLVAPEKADIKITTLAELDEILQKNPKVLVDVTATWCVECKIMERTLFTNRPKELADYQVIKLDVTDTTDDSRAVLARYNLFGPPALLLYKNQKLETTLLGEVGRNEFVKALSAL